MDVVFLYLIVSDNMAGMRLSESGTSGGKLLSCVIVYIKLVCVIQLVILVGNPMWITSLLLILKLLCPYHDQVCVLMCMHACKA